MTTPVTKRRTLLRNRRPAAVSSLTATAGESKVSLSWPAVTGQAKVSGYRIYRNGTAVATVPASVTTYDDTGLAGGTEVAHFVRAYGPNGEGGDSPTQRRTPLVPAAIYPEAALLAWYRNEDIPAPNVTTLTWADASGHGRHLSSLRSTAAKVTTQRFNGQKSLNFEGGDTRMASAPWALPVSYTMFVAMHVGWPTNNPTAGSMNSDYGSTSPFYMQVFGSSLGLAYLHNGVLQDPAGISVDWTNRFGSGPGCLLTVRKHSTGWNLRINGTHIGARNFPYTPTAGGTNAFAIGGRLSVNRGVNEQASTLINGHVGEWVIYDGNLSDARALEIERYIGSKMKLAIA